MGGMGLVRKSWIIRNLLAIHGAGLVLIAGVALAVGQEAWEVPAMIGGFGVAAMAINCLLWWNRRRDKTSP
jgi:hypothetical protein